MRQSIILPGKFEPVFLYEARKTGLIEELPSYADDLYNKEELAEANHLYDIILESKKETRKKIFRMLLLFEEIILPQASPVYDYNQLQSVGNFRIISFEEFYYDNPIYKEEHVLYAEQLKPAIIPVAEKELKRYFKVIPENINYSNFVSDLYDTIINGRKLSPKYNQVSEINRVLFNLRNEKFLLKAEIEKWPENLRADKRFYADVSRLIQRMYEDLCWQLQISSDNDATIMNCEYQLANIGCEMLAGDVESIMDAYKILRVECGKILGTLPEVKSIQEALHIKEKRHHDLHNLRQELAHLEYEIRNAGNIAAVEKAAKDISKASKALSIGSTVSKVNKWTTNLLLPMGIISMFSKSPEIAIGTGILTAAGRSATIIGEKISKGNNWFELLI